MNMKKMRCVRNPAAAHSVHATCMAVHTVLLRAPLRVHSKVTSGTMSPSMKIGIGLGYVATEFTSLDTEIFIEIREKGVKAKVVKLPFYKAS